jgi:hypothetical protein
LPAEFKRNTRATPKDHEARRCTTQLPSPPGLRILQSLRNASISNTFIYELCHSFVLVLIKQPSLINSQPSATLSPTSPNPKLSVSDSILRATPSNASSSSYRLPDCASRTITQHLPSKSRCIPILKLCSRNTVRIWTIYGTCQTIHVQNNRDT